MYHQALNSSSSSLSLPLGSNNDQECHFIRSNVSVSDEERHKAHKHGSNKYTRTTYQMIVAFFCLVVLLVVKYCSYQPDIKNKIVEIYRDFSNQEDLPIYTTSSVSNSTMATSSTEPNNYSTSVSYSVDEMGITHEIASNFNYDAVQVIKRERLLKERIQRLEKEIQRISRLETIERFGVGPYQVEFDVTIMRIDGDMKNKIHGTFVVEMAPLDDMPHSVHTFLHMIDNELWDGTAFVHDVEHVILALPVSPKSDSLLEEKFEKASGTSLLFQEYADNFPHVKYTLGFSGRPGGPQFYISTEDNTNHHGPRGQDHHVLNEEADPCFAKVVSGFEVVKKMHDENAFERDGAVVSLINKVHILKK